MFQFCSEHLKRCGTDGGTRYGAALTTAPPGSLRVPGNSLNKSLTSGPCTSRPSVAFRRRLFLRNRDMLVLGIEIDWALAPNSKPLRDQRKRIRTGDDAMKKFLLGTVGLVALSLAAPASAADLAARPYTKAPPDDRRRSMTGAASTSVSTAAGDRAASAGTSSTPAGAFVVAEGCHDATGGTVGGQIGYRWQARSWVFGLEAQGNWADFHGQQREPARSPALHATTPASTPSACSPVRSVTPGNNALLYVKGGAAVTSDRYRSTSRPATGVLVANASTTPAGVAWSASASNTASPRTGRPASNTITCSCRTRPSTSPTTALRRAGTLFANDRIRQDVDLVTVRVNYRWGGPVVAKY